MLFDEEWPDEPRESDPSDRWGDPERDLTNVPEAPAPPDPSKNDVPADVARSFWGVVLLANVGLFAVCLGPMLAFFRGQWTLGGVLVVFGLLTFVHGYRVYRGFRQRHPAAGGDDESTDADGGDVGADTDRD